MNVDAQEAINQISADAAADLAAKIQQIAVLKVQVKNLQAELEAAKQTANN